MAASCLVDRYGSAISTNTLYRTPSQMGGEFRPIARPRAKTYEAVQSWQRREMVDVSRVLAAGVTNIDTALTFAGDFAIGDSWHIKSRSDNKAWGKKRDEWFNKFYMKDCNARGRQSDWHSTLRQLNWMRKVHGDYGIVFDGQSRKDALTGKAIDPTGKFQIIKFDRISTGLIGSGRGSGSVEVGKGLDECKELPRSWNYYSSTSPYSVWPGIYLINDPSSRFDGFRIIDGVIVDANMITAGYRITGFTESGVPTYFDCPRQLIHFNFSARRDSDLIRGIPELAEAILPLMGLDDIQYLVTMAVKLASALAITRKSTDGNPTMGGRATYDETIPGISGNEVTTKRSVQEIFPGIVELAASNGEELGALAFNRPSMNEEAFISRVETAVLHKLWPRSLIYASETGRAGTRAIGMQANAICTWDQMCCERDARWIADRATEFGMRMGAIPTNDNLYDPYNYVFTCPGRFTVDEGNDMKMRLSALGRCCISHGIICEMDGYLKEEIREEREEEIDWIATAAERMAKKHPAFTEKEIALMFDNVGGNVSFTDDAMQDADDPIPVSPAPAVPAAKPKSIIIRRTDSQSQSEYTIE